MRVQAWAMNSQRLPGGDRGLLACLKLVVGLTDSTRQSGHRWAQQTQALRWAPNIALWAVQEMFGSSPAVVHVFIENMKGSDTSHPT